MTVRPHFQRSSPESLRDYAKRRREYADGLGDEIQGRKRSAGALRLNGKAFAAGTQEQLANHALRAQRSAFAAAEAADRQANELESIEDLKEVAQ